MGKKSGRNKQEATTAFVLKVPMHCRCNGCDDKIRAGVKDLTLNHGIEALDQSALWTKGELRVVASTEDPEKLRRRLHKATGKTIGLVIIKPQQQAAPEKEANVAALEELLRRSLQQQQQQGQYGQAAWPNQVMPGAYGYAAAAPAYHHPWAVQVQQQEAYPSYYQSAYPAASTGGASWGAYAYPTALPAPAQLGHGAYGGGWPY